MVLGICGLGLRGQVRDVGCELGEQLLRPVVADGPDRRGVDVGFGAIDRYDADLLQPRKPRDQQDIEERRFENRPVLAAEQRIRV